MAAIFILAQAGTGWRGPSDKAHNEVGDGDAGVAVVADAEEAIAEPLEGLEPVPSASTNDRQE